MEKGRHIDVLPKEHPIYHYEPRMSCLDGLQKQWNGLNNSYPTSDNIKHYFQALSRDPLWARGVPEVHSGYFAHMPVFYGRVFSQFNLASQLRTIHG